MNLVNATPVPARLLVVEALGKLYRNGVVTAKATFRITKAGAELDTQAPLPVLTADRETELGILPRDELPGRDRPFEIFVLGAAYAPPGDRAGRVDVAVTIDRVRREIAVFGDRAWEPGDPQTISPPEPFSRIPLVWDRAFGGNAEVLVDDESPIVLSDPRNPGGRGFEPGPTAKEICRAWKAPAGYPRYDDERRLPNLEAPSALVTRREDAPLPVCWSPLPQGSTLRAAADPPDGPLPWIAPRIHPDWAIPAPPPGAEVSMEGMTPDGEPLRFTLPRLRVLADYSTGPHEGTRELRPCALVLLAEERRFYVVYRHAFTIVVRPGVARSMRLRVESGGAGFA